MNNPISESHSHTPLLVYAFSVLTSIAFTTTCRAAFLDEMLRELGFSPSQGTLIVFTEMFASGLATVFFAYISRFLVKRNIARIAMFVYAFAIIMYSITPQFWLLMTIGFGALMGLSVNLMFACVNILVYQNDKQKNIRNMNLLHVFFGVGAILSPIYVAWILDILSWRYVFVFASVIPLFLILVTTFILGKHPALDTISSEHKKSQENRINFFQELGILFKNRKFVLFFFAILLYTGTDAPYITWLVGYLEHIWGVENIWGNRLGLSGWLCGVMIGRLAASYLYKRLKEGSVIIGFLIGILGMVISILTEYPVLIYGGIFLNGLSFSFLYPTIIALSSQRLDYNRDMLLSMMFTAATAGAVTFSSTMGLLNDISRDLGILQPIFTAIIGMIVVIVLRNLIKKDTDHS